MLRQTANPPTLHVAGVASEPPGPGLESPGTLMAGSSAPDVTDPAAAFRLEMQRLLACRGLRQRPTLRRLLLHLARGHMEGDPGRLKESVIAAEVFGRDPAHFDAQRDAIVRVSALRLRQELSAHYAGDGHTSDLAIELHSGSYVLQVRPRHAGTATWVPGLAIQALRMRDADHAEGQAQDAQARAFTDALIAAVHARWPGVRVTVLPQDGGDPQSEAAALGADTLVGGHVERVGDALRVALWTCPATPDGPARSCALTVGQQAWTHSPTQVAAQALSALGPEVWPVAGDDPPADRPGWPRAARPSSRDAVLNLVSRSRMLLRGGEPAQVQRALQLARAALACGPELVEAHIGMARLLISLHAAHPAGSQAAAHGALRHAAQAVRLDPACAAAQALEGLLQLQVALDPVAALEAIERARGIAPDDVDVLGAWAEWCTATARVDEALQAWSDARRRDPLDLGLHKRMARTLEIGGRDAQAMQVWRDIAEVELPTAGTLYGIARALRRLDEAGSHAEAVATLQRRHPDHPLTWHARALALVDAGQVEQAMALRRAQAACQGAAVPWLHRAEQSLAAGDADQALEALLRAMRKPEPGVHLVPHDAVFRPLHDHPHAATGLFVGSVSGAAVHPPRAGENRSSISRRSL